MTKVKLAEDHHDADFFLGEITEVYVISGAAKESGHVTVKLNGQPAEFKEDTGVDVIVNPPNIFLNKVKPVPELARTNNLLMGPNKQKLMCNKTFTAVRER